MCWVGAHGATVLSRLRDRHSLQGAEQLPQAPTPFRALGASSKEPLPAQQAGTRWTEEKALVPSSCRAPASHPSQPTARPVGHSGNTQPTTSPLPACGGASDHKAGSGGPEEVAGGGGLQAGGGRGCARPCTWAEHLEKGLLAPARLLPLGCPPKLSSSWGLDVLKEWVNSRDFYKVHAPFVKLK